jgi:lycopene beta-cyclase
MSIDIKSFNMMDFNTPQDGAVQFIYVLPFSPSKFLVELTRFGTDLIDTKRAYEILEKYIIKKYGRYTLLEKETGCIPMSQQKIDTTKIPRVTNIGSRNYNIKASTGYAFKNMYLQAKKISSSLLRSAQSNKKSFIAKNRFKLYDGLLLDIIEHHPYLGKEIFTRLFKI